MEPKAMRETMLAVEINSMVRSVNNNDTLMSAETPSGGSYYISARFSLELCEFSLTWNHRLTGAVKVSMEQQ